MRKLLVGAVTCAVVGLPAPGAGAGSSFTGCSEPGAAFATADPAHLGLDAGKLQAAVDFVMSRMSRNVHVYRTGCLVGGARLPGTEGTQNESFSIAKTATALLAGRAHTMGLLEVTDTVGDYFPEATGTYATVTVHDLLTQSSGVHWNFFRDYLLALDRIKDFFALDFDHSPGTFFEYAQTPITVLAEIVGRAAGKKVELFAQDELFGPLGIAPGSWRWTTDAAGHAAGYYGLNMGDTDFARLGELMRRGGVWNGVRLIDAGFLADAVTPSVTNPVYGYLIWLNNPEGGVAPTIYGRDVRHGPPIQTAPADLYMAAGYQDQRIYVIPSLQMVVTRFGYPGSRETDTRASFWTSASGEFEHELMRLLMEAVTDPEGRAHIPAPVPYESPETVPTIDPYYSIVDSATEADQIVEAFTSAL